MKLIIIISLIGVVCCDSIALDSLMGIDDQIAFANEINAAQKNWTAGDNFGRPLSAKELARFGSTIIKKPDLPLKRYRLSQLGAIPESFDLRTKYPQCRSLSSVKDQSNCGSCWAVTSAATFSDRICIASNGARQVNISAESLMDCCSYCGYGCDGGHIDRTWSYFQRRGEVTGGDYNTNDGCQPYSIKPCGNDGQPACDVEEMPTPACKFYCTNPTYPIRYRWDMRRTRNAYYMAPNIRYLQQEIMNHGPMVAQFNLYKDFPTYKKGVYVRTSGTLVGGHAARVIGWGREDGKDYWLAVNSWGSSWGDNGTFKILRGVNHCRFESYMVGGEAYRETMN